MSVAAPPAPATGRAGRNLPVAIGVGLGMGAAVLVPLYTVKSLFIGVLVAAIATGLWELDRVLRARGLRPPFVPLLIGAVSTIVLAYLRGTDALAVAALLTALAVVLWRLGDGGPGFVPDVSAALFELAYVPVLAAFAALLLVPADGSRRVTVFIATVVCSDVGGYAAGVVAGRHPMAPSISPKKSWEGFAGSALACAVAGVLFLPLLLHGTWWQGVVYGLAVVVSATVGDLGESMVKRDLGIKDMGSLLPGHGGLMDRLDSLLPTAPVAYLVLSAFVPPH